MPGGEPKVDETPSTYMPYGATGGGGQGGNYVFTDLAHLDRIITRWTTLRDEIAADGVAIGAAIQKIVPPAEDRPSILQAKAARTSLYQGQLHNEAMIKYVNNYIDKLQATRARYAATEESNTDTLRHTDGQ